jgi:orotidine-5'-phosphate decarboxylase
MDTATLWPPTDGATYPALTSSKDPKDQLIVALDFPSAHEALRLADELQGLCRWVKVGMELYYAAGNPVIEQLRTRGFNVFLDLKLYDIPNTVAGAIRSVTGAGASLLTVHAGGGASMLSAAAQAADRPDAPKLLAVTIVTSMNAVELSGVGVTDTPAAQVMRLARLAKVAGIDGLVCSTEEVLALRAAMGPDATLVVPGIRPSGADLHDQKRVAAPADAIAQGASMLVVGRPITRAKDPAIAAAAILAEMAR